MKKRSAWFVCMVCGSYHWRCGDDGGGTDGKGAEQKQFIVGFDAEFPPYGYMDDNGEYVGFDLDLAAEVCKRNGWKLVNARLPGIPRIRNLRQARFRVSGMDLR